MSSPPHPSPCVWLTTWRSVCLALPDILLRIPRLHKGLYLRRPTKNRSDTMASSGCMDDTCYGCYLRHDCVYKPFRALQAIVSNLEW